MVVMSKMLFHWENFSSFLHLSLNMVWRYKRYEKCHFPPCFLMFHMYYYCLKKRKNHAFDKRVFNTISSETFHGIIRFYLSATSGTTATRFPWKIGTPIGDIHNLFISTKVKYSDQRQLAKTQDQVTEVIKCQLPRQLTWNCPLLNYLKCSHYLPIKFMFSYLWILAFWFALTIYFWQLL